MDKEIMGNTCQKWDGETTTMQKPRPIKLPCTVHFPRGEKLELHALEPSDYSEIKLASASYCREGACISCQAWIINEHMVYFKNITGYYQHVSSLGLAPVQLKAIRFDGVDYLPFRPFKDNEDAYKNVERIAHVGVRGYHFVPETGKVVKFVSPVK